MTRPRVGPRKKAGATKKQSCSCGRKKSAAIKYKPLVKKQSPFYSFK
jgi:hypothetical protein